LRLLLPRPDSGLELVPLELFLFEVVIHCTFRDLIETHLERSRIEI
jgi:hypothetical protein